MPNTNKKHANNGMLPVFSYERGEIMYSNICQTIVIVYETEGVEGNLPSKCNEWNTDMYLLHLEYYQSIVSKVCPFSEEILKRIKVFWRINEQEVKELFLFIYIHLQTFSGYCWTIKSIKNDRAENESSALSDVF